MAPNIASVFTDHLPLKLLALLFGLAVYAHVYTEQEREATFRVPLRIASLPPDLVLREPAPEFAELTARASGKQLLKLRFEEPEIVVDLSGVTSGNVQRMLSPSDVVLPVGMEVAVTSVVDPRVVTFVIDTVLVREVAVQPAVVGKPPEGFGLAGPVTARPDRVRVRGPSAALNQVSHVTTDPVDLSMVREAGEWPVSLRVVEGLAVDPETVDLLIPMVELAERVVRVSPVRVTGLSRGLLARVEPDTAWVTLAGPEQDLAALDPERVRGVLNGEGLALGRHLLPLEVTVPHPERVRLVAVDPARFLVEIGRPSR